MKILIITIKDKNDENDFIKIINEIDETNKKIKFCIDFEFNKKELGLMQLYITYINKIYLFNPEFFSTNNKLIMIQKIFLSQNKKILHGSESNDIPYIFNTLLQRDPDKICLFINNYYDTRFICSYLGFVKCNLYSALISCKIINEEKLKYLESIEHKMGDIWKIRWNPLTLSNYEKIYAFNDVLFLSKLFRKQKNLCKIAKLKLRRLAYALRIVILYRQNMLQYFNIEKIDNVENYFTKIIDIEYLRKLKLIL